MATLFLKTLALLCSFLNSTTVYLSSALTISYLNESGQLHSLVAHNLVPRFTPSAPRASAAANCLPSPTPPLQIKGTDNAFAPLACRTKFPTSSSPG